MEGSEERKWGESEQGADVCVCGFPSDTTLCQRRRETGREGMETKQKPGSRRALRSTFSGRRRRLSCFVMRTPVGSSSGHVSAATRYAEGQHTRHLCHASRSRFASEETSSPDESSRCVYVSRVRQRRKRCYTEVSLRIFYR